MDMPKPSEGHKRLERLAGTWEGEETMVASEWDPKGGTATGRNAIRTALGGFASICDYEQERDGKITFTGHSIMTYDPKADLYSLYWVDCMGSPPETFEGRFDGDRLVVGHGGRMHVRLTYDLSDPAVMASKMEMSPDGSTWKTLFEGRYKKVP